MSALISRTDDALGDAVYVVQLEVSSAAAKSDDNATVDGCYAALAIVKGTAHCLKHEKRSQRAISAAGEAAALGILVAAIEPDALAKLVATQEMVTTVAAHFAARLRAPPNPSCLAALSALVDIELAQYAKGKGSFVDFAGLAITVALGALSLGPAKKPSVPKAANIACGLLSKALASDVFDAYARRVYSPQSLQDFVEGLLSAVTLA